MRSSGTVLSIIGNSQLMVHRGARPPQILSQLLHLGAELHPIALPKRLQGAVIVRRCAPQVRRHLARRRTRRRRLLRGNLDSRLWRAFRNDRWTALAAREQRRERRFEVVAHHGVVAIGRQHTLEFGQLAILRADIQRLDVKQRILERYDEQIAEDYL
jgi:hypothetical protein